jgi:hypothetical protein
MTLSPGRHAARTPGASRALTPSTIQGGHPGWRGALVATTMASSGRCRRGFHVSFALLWGSTGRPPRLSFRRPVLVGAKFQLHC